MRTAVGDPGSRRALTQFVKTGIVSRVLRALHCPEVEAEVRGGLLASQILGVVIGRYVLGLPALTGLPPDVLVANVGPTLRHYLTGAITKPH